MRAASCVAVALTCLAACGDSGPGVAPACAASDVQRCVATQVGCALPNGAPECVRCVAGESPDVDGRCGPIRGTARAHDFPMQTIAAGGESLNQCRSWTLNNDEDLWVAGVELSQNEASHHSNWTFAPEAR